MLKKRNKNDFVEIKWNFFKEILHTHQSFSALSMADTLPGQVAGSRNPISFKKVKLRIQNFPIGFRPIRRALFFHLHADTITERTISSKYWEYFHFFSLGLQCSFQLSNVFEC